MRLFNMVFCILFLICAGLQYNDPDPYLWIPIYLYGAILCGLAWRNKFHPAYYLIGIIGYAAYATYLFFAQDGVLDWITKHQAENIAGSMHATKPWIEETREFFGLLILIIVLLIDYFYAKRKPPVPLKGELRSGHSHT